MKKLTSILLALVLVFSFAACSNNSSDNSNTTSSTSQTADTSKSTDENTQNSNTQAPRYRVDYLPYRKSLPCQKSYSLNQQPLR